MRKFEQVAKALFDDMIATEIDAKVAPWENAHPAMRARMLSRARAAIEALREPDEEMWGGLARQIIMWARMDRAATGHNLHDLLKMRGTPIPGWLAREIPDVHHVPPKGAVAVAIFRAMIDAILSETEGK
jgi:hypothetical protein